MNKKLIFYLIAAFIFSYVLIRAILLGITYDEAWTIHTFVPLSVYHIFSFEPCDANNQILNTLLIKAFFITGNHSLFLARLPNVMAFLMFAYFSYKISSGFLNKIMGISLFIVLLFNPFILDFFSLARGYGLAMTCQMGALFQLLKFAKNNKLINFGISLAFAILATLSNFTFLYFFIAVLCVGNYISLIWNKINMNYLKALGTSIIATIFLVLLIYTPLMKLVKNQSLYYGGTEGFYPDTLISLSSYSLYHPYNLQAAQIVLNVFIIALVLVVLFYVMKRTKLNSGQFIEKAVIVLLLTGITVFVNLMNHYISGTLYLTDRTALMFFPLFMMMIFFFADNIIYMPLKIPSVIVVITISVISLINFTINANFVKTISWSFDAHTEKILNKINNMGMIDKTVKTIDFSWPLESSINYYMHKNKYSNLAVVKDENDREKLNAVADFYIYYGKSQEKVGYFSDEQLILNIKKDTAWSYVSEDTYVFKNLEKIKGGRL